MKIEEIIRNILDKIDSCLWNTAMGNNKSTQGFIRSYYPLFFLILFIGIYGHIIDAQTKKLYAKNNALIKSRSKTHNIEITIGKEYIIKTSEEYIIEETKNRGLKLQENITPPIRIYIHE